MSAALANDINLGEELLCFSQIGLFRSLMCVQRALSLLSPSALRYLVNSAGLHTCARTHTNTQERVYNTGSLFLIIIPIQ